MINVTFEHVHDAFPPVTEGPFAWVEMIGGNMWGCRADGEEAVEVAGLNRDGTWDAGPRPLPPVAGLRPAYTRWAIG